ncbi:MAG TPA: FAD-binding protein, partial [Candidatus Limnocylindrales bacterium]|nr:FAD-binding protein [Candidatus Limnocylindrales bacterium]
MSGPVLAVIALGPEGPERASLEALALARGVAAAAGSAVEAVFLADATTARSVAQSLAGRGITRALVVEDARLTVDHPDAWATAIAQIATARGAEAVVGAGTERGNDLLARAAARLDVPMVANCLTVEPGATYAISRQRWAGSLIEECRLEASTKVLTVAPNSVPAEAPDSSAAPTIEAADVTITDADLAVHVTGREAPERGRISLTDAKVVVGGGRGVGSTEGFAELEELAALLGGAVGGSRVVTSAGWRPHADQIGQTGLRIA